MCDPRAGGVRHLPRRFAVTGCREWRGAGTPGVGPPGPDACASLFSFEGTGRDLVVALKYRNGRELGRLLGSAMAELVDPAGLDAVTWAPTSPVRRAQRGYDQSRLLAGGLARALDLPCRDLLRRQAGGPQTGRTLAQRQVGPQFRARGPSPGRVVVVDDVITTGATLAAASGALRQSGARQVLALTAACTPCLHAGRPLKTGVRSAEKKGVTETAADRSSPPMQVTELQVQRSLRALTDTEPGGQTTQRRRRAPRAGPVRSSRSGIRRPRRPRRRPARRAWSSSSWRSPAIRDDRLAEVRLRLEAGEQPSAEDLAQRMVGRLVCDRLR